MNILRHAVRGCTDLPGYGPHPGTKVLLIYMIFAGFAGTDKGGINGFVGGMLIAMACLGPFYLIGAVSRSRDLDRDQAQLLKMIKDV
jgi:hypothetical protein